MQRSARAWKATLASHGLCPKAAVGSSQMLACANDVKWDELPPYASRSQIGLYQPASDHQPRYTYNDDDYIEISSDVSIRHHPDDHANQGDWYDEPIGPA